MSSLERFGVQLAIAQAVDSARRDGLPDPNKIIVAPGVLEKLYHGAGDGSSFSAGQVGSLFGIPVISSPFIEPGKAIIGHFAGLEYGEPLSYEPDLYAEPASSIKGYIQRAANALRADLGLELVNYAQEAEHERWRRHYEWASERFLMIHAVGGYSTNLLAGLGG